MPLARVGGAEAPPGVAARVGTDAGLVAEAPAGGTGRVGADAGLVLG
jgi:hypothetical protein